jgi:ElaB/YqjD/DUF883 family membrane-anchored ribosome-binding protein
MNNRALYFRDPGTIELLNNGVSKVSEIGQDEKLISTLRFELETFVCDGEYARGLQNILEAYLKGLESSEQNAVWVSGFFGSGKSHLVKVLRYLWEDYSFPDGATARSLVHLPDAVNDLLKELSNKGKKYGGLRAAGGTLGAGTMSSVRLAFIQLVLRAAGLPENLAQAQFVLWLRSSGMEQAVIEELRSQKKTLLGEVKNMMVSKHLASALLAVDPTRGSVENVQKSLREQFKSDDSPSLDVALDVVKRIFGVPKAGGGEVELPCTLLVVDEVQQFLAGDLQRTMELQEIVEYCSTKLGQRVLFVGTGQSALTDKVSNLQRLQARFRIKVQLSDADVESVIRKVVLRKKPDHEKAIHKCLDANHGEVDRQLQGTRFASRAEDEQFLVTDYPLLPSRRRFWEKVLRNTDHSGTKSQLRSQLQIVFDAAQKTADAELGTVVPADFIYDQIASDLLNTGELNREYHEIIGKQRDGGADAELRFSLCALIFLIGKLPRSQGADDGVRANAETLVDLLISDLKSDRVRLESRVPALLKQLVDRGHLMEVDGEYRLQTPESSKWNQMFNQRRSAILSDDAKLGEYRLQLLREGVGAALKPVSLSQGQSGATRKFLWDLSSNPPASDGEQVVLWMREGWSDDEKSVLKDAGIAGADGTVLFGYLPRREHEELRSAIAMLLAAKETLDHFGSITSAEATEAKKSIETHLQSAQSRLKQLVGTVVGAAKVYLGGGHEAVGIELCDKVRDAAQSAMTRQFPKFGVADQVGWGQVIAKAKSGDSGALGQVGYQGEVAKNPVCKAVLEFIGPGKKGREVQTHFQAAPYGWSRDAVDGALYALVLAGNLRATENGSGVQATQIAQNKIASVAFHVDVPPIDVGRKLQLKAFFQKCGVQAEDGKMSEAAVESLRNLLLQIQAAGGESPRPEVPDSALVRDLQAFSGNEQLGRIHDSLKDLSALWDRSKKTAEAISGRWPAWNRLHDLVALAGGLPEAESCARSMRSIEEQRGLLGDPDPVPALTQSLVAALRVALGGMQRDLKSAYAAGDSYLTASPIWMGLTVEQREAIKASCNLTPPTEEPLATEEQILSALRGRTLSDRRNLQDAVPQRFQRALEEAVKLATPEAVRVTLPSVVLTTQQDLDSWLASVRALIEEKLKNGPVSL